MNAKCMSDNMNVTGSTPGAEARAEGRLAQNETFTAALADFLLLAADIHERQKKPKNCHKNHDKKILENSFNSSLEAMPEAA